MLSTKLFVQRLCELEHIVLRRVVGREPRSRHKSRKRRNIQYIPVVALLELLQEQLRKDMHSLDIYVDHFKLTVKIGLGELSEYAESRIVDEYVDVRALDFLVKLSAFVGIRKIVAEYLHLYPVGFHKLVLEFKQTLSAPCNDNEIEPALGEYLRKRTPESGARTGYECYHVVTFLYILFSVFMSFISP